MPDPSGSLLDQILLIRCFSRCKTGHNVCFNNIISSNVPCASRHHVRIRWNSQWRAGMSVNCSGRCVWSTMPSSSWPRNRNPFIKLFFPAKAPDSDTGRRENYSVRMYRGRGNNVGVMGPVGPFSSTSWPWRQPDGVKVLHFNIDNDIKKVFDMTHRPNSPSRMMLNHWSVVQHIKISSQVLLLWIP